MVDKKLHQGKAHFAIKPGKGAQKVCLAGCFNGWKPQPMQKSKDGTFMARVSLKPGTYQYKFVIDEIWMIDPDHSDWAANPLGTMNSIAQVE